MHYFLPQTSHKKTFFYLEQLILKHNAHQNTVKIKQESGKMCQIVFRNFFCLVFFVLSVMPSELVLSG